MENQEVTAQNALLIDKSRKLPNFKQGDNPHTQVL
jgi:hypothetical protein